MKQKYLSLLFFFFVLILGITTAVSAKQQNGTIFDHFLYLPLVKKPAYILNKNVLLNSSFEGDWYHPGDVPEFQIPEHWEFDYLSDENGDPPLDPDPQNIWQPPEVRVLYQAYLPPHEQDQFIWDGEHTVKVFKGYSAVSFELSQLLLLDPGIYLFEVHVFPDMVAGYVDGHKVYASDPLSAEIRLSANGGDTGWMMPTIGQKNRITYQFNVGQQRWVRVKVEMRGRWALENNGWFLDDWALYTTTQE